MLQVSNLAKSYGGQTVLDNITFRLNRGEHVGVVGSNGCGKTTLLRIIAGQEEPDSGHVALEAKCTIGYLAQGMEQFQAASISEYVRSGSEGLDQTRARVERLGRLVAEEAKTSSSVIEEYKLALAEWEALDGYTFEHRVASVMDGLGLGCIDPATPLGNLSGGQKTRAGLARLLLARPSLLLLDEPTNHLDIQALEWLETFLSDFDGAILLVSHDSTFLNATVTRILEIEDDTHHLAEYAGDYSFFAAEKRRLVEKQWSDWSDQQEEIERLKRASGHLRQLAQFRRGGKADSNDKFAKGFFANRGLQTMGRAKHLEARLKRLETDDKIAKPKQEWHMKLEFGRMPRPGQAVLRLENVGHRFGDQWLFRDSNLTASHAERIALLGANGSGKTTLLRIIVGALDPSEGSVHQGANVHLGYMPQEQGDLDLDSNPLQIIRLLAPMDETAARHFLHLFLFKGDEVFVPLRDLSYGVRARLCLARLVVSGANCLILDEPINHLDIPSRERFAKALDAFPGMILMAMHDRAFIDRFATAIWAIDDGALRRYADRMEANRGHLTNKPR